MKRLNYILLALLVVFCTNCERSTEPIENDKPPPGFQEDIPWPSLADSPWQMYHGDPQSTGRSKYPGPISGTIDWFVDSLYTYSGISIGDGSGGNAFYKVRAKIDARKIVSYDILYS